MEVGMTAGAIILVLSAVPIVVAGAWPGTGDGRSFAIGGAFIFWMAMLGGVLNGFSIG